MWWFKFYISIMVDTFDMTVGRIIFVFPFAGEIVGVAFGCAMFGKKGLIYIAEAIDVTEQIDGFIPTATIIALYAKKDHDEERRLRREQQRLERSS